MNRERYLERALHGVLGPPERVERFAADLRAHFEGGSASGDTDAQVAARLGAPEEVAAAFMESIDLRPAGLLARTFAFVGDIGLCFLSALPFVVIAIVATAAGQEPGPVFLGAAIAVGLALTGVFLLYFPLFEGRFGWTPAKRLMGLHVLAEDWKPITFGQAFLRRLSMYFEFLVLDSLFVPFTARKQRAFDRVAKTVVVWRPEADRAAWRWFACLTPWLVFALVCLAFALPELRT